MRFSGVYFSFKNTPRNTIYKIQSLITIKVNSKRYSYNYVIHTYAIKDNCDYGKNHVNYKKRIIPNLEAFRDNITIPSIK